MPHLAAVWNSADRPDDRSADDRAAKEERRSRQRDAARRDEVLCAEAPRLRRLVHRLLGYRARGQDLDDLVQDVLLAAFRHRDGFRGDAALSTWLTRIALHKVQDHHRAHRLRRRLFAWFGHGHALPAPEAADGDGDIDERLDATRRALQQLPHRDREVLVLRYLEQRGIDEVAELLELTRASVDTRLSRARKRLRAILDREGER